MCRCCQSCWEDLYWNCIEERFCFDKSIAEYNPDDDEFITKNNIKIVSNGQDNNNQTPILTQPMKKNESSIFSSAKIDEDDVRREIQTNIPFLAPEVLAVFTNSQIFQENQKLSRIGTKTGITPIHSPTTPKEKQLASEQKKLIFQLEGNQNDNIETDQQTVSNSVPCKDRTSDHYDAATLQNITQATNNKITFSFGDKPIEVTTNKKKFSIIPEKDEDEIDDSKIPTVTITPSDDESNTIVYNSQTSIPKSSTDTLTVDGDEVVLRPKFDNTGENLMIGGHRPLRNVHSMPQIKQPNVRPVASETDIFSIYGSTGYGQFSMTPEVPSISFVNLPKNYEDTPTIEQYKETMSLYKLQTVNKQMRDSQNYDYSMPSYFKKTLARSSQNLDGNTDISYSKESVSIHHQHQHQQNQHHSGLRIFEKSKRLKQLRDNLPPLIIHRHHKKDDHKQAH